MNKKNQGIALAGMMTALSIVIMFLGIFLQIGTYMVPMFVGLLLIPIYKEYGRKLGVMTWTAVSILSMFLLSDKEMALMYVGFFGWYPLGKSFFDKIKVPFRMILKLLMFNGIMVGIYSMLIFVMGLTGLSETKGMVIALLIIGSITFLIYDKALIVFERFYEIRFRKWFRH